MEKKELCSIIKDLLPSYVEKLTNKETNKFIESHIEKCQECKKILENMRKEIEIDAPKNEEKQFKYIKSYSKRLKLLRNILVIIALIFILIVARRFIIITNLDNKASSIQAFNNYHIKLECYQDAEIIFYEKHNKDEKSLTVEKIYNINNLDNVIQYTHYKSDTEDFNLTSTTQSKNILLDDTKSYVNITNYTLKFHTVFKKLYFALTTSIQNVSLDESECYLIKIGNTERFIDVKTGLVIKFIDNDENTVRDYHYEFNTVTDEDVARPDTTGYTIIDE